MDDDGKISQIRLSWDQGSLLKQLEVIGKTGRNWPIKDSKEQIALIQSSVKASDAGLAASASGNSASLSHRSRGSSTNAIRDPHSTLHMQPTREELENAAAETFVAPYAGSRPQPRRYEDIISDEPKGDGRDSPHDRSPSKSGQGKNYQPMRLFEGQEEAAEEDSPKGRPASQYIRPDPRKFKHFDFDDGSNAPHASKSGAPADQHPKSKHGSQWSFDDFVTPVKPKPSKTMAMRHHDTGGHFGVDDDPADNGDLPAGKGRRDAETHFELRDDGEQVPKQERSRPKGSIHNDGLGLYKNNLFNQDGSDAPPERTLGNITNLKDRSKDFEPQWEMRDESPAPAQPQRSQPIPEYRQKAVKMMEANWSAVDQSPAQEKENSRLAKPQPGGRIHIAGDGMGGKKGTNRDWMVGGDGGDQGRIHIAGDGMGGKKGTNRDWMFGGDGA